jgi:hypothetical protein
MGLSNGPPEKQNCTFFQNSCDCFESESYVTTDGQTASMSWSKAPTWSLRPDLYYLCDSYGLVLVGREVGSVFCMCCWPLPAQSFSGPSPLRLETIFYCHTFETSLFVASYDSQGHGRSMQTNSPNRNSIGGTCKKVTVCPLASQM